jgi:hypothetical protein
VVVVVVKHDAQVESCDDDGSCSRPICCRRFSIMAVSVVVVVVGEVAEEDMALSVAMEVILAVVDKCSCRI